MKAFVLPLALGIAILSSACSGGEEGSSAAATPPMVAAPAAPSPFLASKIAVPLSVATGDHIQAALVAGGWQMASLSQSGSITTALARKNDVSASVWVYNPAQAHHRGHLEHDTKAIYAEGPALIGVRIDGNDAAATVLLTSLIGHPPTVAPAPVAAQPAVAAVAPPIAPVAPVAPVAVPAIPTMPAVPTGGWNGLTPFECTGAQQVVINGVTANLPGVVAITATGMCQLTVINCNISAGQAIYATGASRVTIQGGTIQGTRNSIYATGESNVTVVGAQLVGRVGRSGVATITGAR